MWPFRREYPGLRIVGWGPFPFPGEKKRRQRAQERAEEMMRATQRLRDRDDARAMFAPGERVRFTRADGTTAVYEVEEGESLTMRRIEERDV